MCIPTILESIKSEMSIFKGWNNENYNPLSIFPASFKIFRKLIWK